MQAQESGGRGDVDDAAAVLAHVGFGGLYAPDDGFKAGAHHAAHHLGRELGDGAVTHPHGVAHHDVKAPAGGLERGGCVHDDVSLGHIAAKGHGGVALGRQLGDGLVGQFLFEVQHADRGAQVGQVVHDGAAYAAGAPRDQGHPTFKRPCGGVHVQCVHGHGVRFIRSAGVGVGGCVHLQSAPRAGRARPCHAPPAGGRRAGHRS